MSGGVKGRGGRAGPKIITIIIKAMMERKLNSVYPDILARNQCIDLLLLRGRYYLYAGAGANLPLTSSGVSPL